ncbi:hypothetical protein LCGC14_2116960, partial [marine sediment metagenome]
GSATSDITINTNKFTVAGATGDTVIAGTLAVTDTLDVTGNIDPTTYETTNGGFLDEDAMGSDADDKVASQQSIKAYIDAQIALKTFGAWTDKDSGGSVALAKDSVYRVGSDGFFIGISTGSGNIQVLTDSSNPPTTVRFRANGMSQGNPIITPVRKDDYVKITSSETPTIYWLPIGVGTAVKQ